MADVSLVHAKFGQTGAIVPNRCKAFTIHDTNKMEATTIGVRLCVTAVGAVVFEDWADNEVTKTFDPVGVYYETGTYQRVKSTGATATLSPASTVHYDYAVKK